MSTDKSIGNGMGNGNGFGSAHKEDRWAVNDRRRDDDYHRNSSSRRTRRSRSRSRSPRRSRRSKSRSRSPPPALDRHDRHDRRSSRSPPRYRSDRVGDDSSSKWPSSNGRMSGFSSRGRGSIEDPARRLMNREMAAVEASKRSVKENRVYVGNLAFSVKWSDLKDFMREVGSVVFAEVMVLPNGMSKGCGVVEFSTRAEAERAVKELNDTTLFGRQVFVREDREEEARYGSLAVSGFGARGGLVGGLGGRGGFGGGPPGGHSSFAAAAVPCKQLAVSGLPFNVGWQDLKDMFRSAGNIIRADVYFGADGSPTGNGMVVFETARDAQNAISMFNGFEYEGRTMEVRADRAASINSGFRGGSRGSSRGSFGVRGGRGSGRGGFGGSYGGPGGRDTTNLYGDYSGQSGPPASGPGLRSGPSSGVGRASFGGPSLVIQPNQQIFVKNLPWSTSNEDLVELFQTTGKVQNAEVLFEAGRSKGVGVVEFETVEEAETAIAKFQSYSYGGRPLSLEFNGRWRDFSAVAPGHSGL